MRNVFALGFGFALLLICAARTLAQEPSSSELDLRRAATEAYAAYMKMEDALDAVKEGDEAASDAAWEARAKARRAFTDAFGKTDVAAWPEDAPKRVLQLGYISLSIAAREDGNHTEALRMLDLLLERTPDGETADWVRAKTLPDALFATADPEIVLPRLEALLLEAPPVERYQIARKIARARAATGDYEGARTAYDFAMDLTRKHPQPIPKRKGGPPSRSRRDSSGQRDPNEANRKIVEIERDLVGKPLAPIKATTAIRGTKLSARPRGGTVLVLDTFEITSVIAPMKRKQVLEAVATLKDKRVRVVGITWYPSRMASVIPAKVYMPGNELEPVLVDLKTFASVAKRWHKAAELTYPLLIVPEPGSMVESTVTATLSGPRLVDGAGRVAYQTPMGLDADEMRAAVRMILGRKNAKK